MTNAIAQIFDTPSALPRMLGDAVRGIDPLGGAILGGTASAVHGIASNPLFSTAATAVAGYFGGPLGAAGASAALSRERGDSLEKSLGNGVVAGGLAYGANVLGGGGPGSDVGGGVDEYGNVIGGGNFTGGGADTTDYGKASMPTAEQPIPSGEAATPSVDPTADPRAGDTTPGNTSNPSSPSATDAPKTPEAKSGILDTAKKTATQIGVSAVAASLLSPKKPDTPTPAIQPITPMPDPLAQEAARRRALVEQIMRRGRTSTILTDTGA